MFTNRIDEDFQSMISKRYGVDLSHPSVSKSIFERLDECSSKGNTTHRLNEGKCCGKRGCDEAADVEDNIEPEVEDTDIVSNDAEQGEFSNDKFTVSLEGENGYTVKSEESGKTYRLYDGKALGGTDDAEATFIVEDDADKTCAGLVDTTEISPEMFEAVFDAITEYESESDEEDTSEDEVSGEEDIEFVDEENLEEALNEVDLTGSLARLAKQKLKDEEDDEDEDDPNLDPSVEEKKGYVEFIDKYKAVKKRPKYADSIEKAAEYAWDVLADHKMNSYWWNGAEKACLDLINNKPLQYGCSLKSNVRGIPYKESLNETDNSTNPEYKAGYLAIIEKAKKLKASGKFNDSEKAVEAAWDSFVNQKHSDEWWNGAEDAGYNMIEGMPLEFGQTFDESLNEFRNPFSKETRYAKNRAQELNDYAQKHENTDWEPNNSRDSKIAQWVAKYRYITASIGKYTACYKIVDYDKTATGVNAGKLLIVEPVNDLSRELANKVLTVNQDGKYVATFDDIGEVFGSGKETSLITPNGKKIICKFTSFPHGKSNTYTVDDVRSDYENGEFGFTNKKI